VLNAVMIVSTPTRGGHYLSGVIARIVFGVLSSVVVRCWMAGPRRAAYRLQECRAGALTHRTTLPVGLGDDRAARRVRRVRAGNGPPADDDAVFEDV